ncbi:DUF4232 domain-containing protein [Streptomyces sp. NBC_01497]|uniref:DUF4232 domain-containing protein n=1 Tax=Streptomyces sp. NBC_01497 TaxID=2903885 RepID=UPI002E335A47|nr:DUF4232 domain-containing protein [Streptomyces sp. NBC_01497]
MAKNLERRGTTAVRGSRSSRTRLAASTLALVAASGAVLVGCGNGDPASPQQVSGTAGPATDGGSPSQSASDDTSGTSKTPSGATSPAGQQQASSQAPSGAGTKPAGQSTDSGGTSTSTSASGSRCHTSDLKASVGANDPGAGQENFALVLTNTSGRTCTVYGFPGFAFVDGSGKQVSTDPQREGTQKQVVSLSPGHSAWATLRFPNPGMVGGATVNPAAVEITPPDEKAFLKASWSGGEVSKQPSSAAATIVGSFQSGTGPN